MLIKGADWFVEGTSGIAEKFGIPQIVIGLTIVAMGTSAPEAAVSFRQETLEDQVCEKSLSLVLDMQDLRHNLDPKVGISSRQLDKPFFGGDIP